MTRGVLVELKLGTLVLNVLAMIAKIPRIEQLISQRLRIWIYSTCECNTRTSKPDIKHKMAWDEMGGFVEIHLM